MISHNHRNIACLAFLAASCSSQTENDVSIKNVSDREITTVQFAYADAVFERATIASGDQIRFAPEPTTDGGISLSYVYDDAEVKHALGYASPMVPMNCAIEIDGADIKGGCVQN